MRNFLVTLATAGLVLASPAIAAPKKAAPAKTAPAAPAASGADAGNAERSEHAVLYLKVLISALQSEQIKEDAKTALVACLYGNSLGKITEEMDKVIAQNADKVHRDKPGEVLAVMTAVCGFKGDPANAAPAAKAPTGR